jgi:CHAT domain-containing protein
MRRGQGDVALQEALAAEDAARKFLRTTLRYLPEREALSYVRQRPSGLNVALTLAAGDPTGDPTPVLDAVVRSRALVFDEIAARQRTVESLAERDIADRRSAWKAARQRLANLTVRAGREASSPTHIALLQEARREAERAERVLAEQSAAFQAEHRPDVGQEDVRRRLPSRTALVSFVQYERLIDGGSAASGARTVLSYAAFVLTPALPKPVIVPLGAAYEVDADVVAWRKEVTGGAARSGSLVATERSLRTVGERLKARIWNPIEPHIQNVDRVFIVLDGALHLVNFAALPTGESEYLIDRGPLIHHLTSERDLVELSTAAPATSEGLLALGGAAFDSSNASETATGIPSGVDATRAGCGSFDSMRFNPLPGTRQEVEGLVRIWRLGGRRQAVNLLTGMSASEGAFKARAPGHRVLHLATHGFFLGGDCPTDATQTRAVGGLTAAIGSGAVRATAESPLLQSGLALAGANHGTQAAADEEDGILTAEEVAALKLDGVEWVVLSACDTGLGEIRAGEGVFGLRRAFQIAGARTVIMSLWSVDDQATRSWMRALYEDRFQKGLSTADAVRGASLAVLQERRAKGQSTHPFFWAAFVAAGDWK